MSGNRAGGLAARDTNKLRYGPDYYSKIGAIGGKKGTTGGFYYDRKLASTAGRKGGLISKRRPRGGGERIHVRVINKKPWWELWS